MALDALKNKPADTGKKGRTLDERLRKVISNVAGDKEDGHPYDIVVYRNKTHMKQVIYDDFAIKHVLHPKGWTWRSLKGAESITRDGSGNMVYKVREKDLIPYPGDTIILSRMRGVNFVARGILEEIEVLDAANPGDYE